MEVLTPRAETQLIADPITGEEKEMIRVREDYIFNAGLIEDWYFDAVTGKTTVQIKAIAFFEREDKSRIYQTVRPILFLVKYEDFKNIAKVYD